jgi:hypothetical protein
MVSVIGSMTLSDIRHRYFPSASNTSQAWDSPSSAFSGLTTSMRPVRVKGAPCSLILEEDLCIGDVPSIGRKACITSGNGNAVVSVDSRDRDIPPLQGVIRNLEWMGFIRKSPAEKAYKDYLNESK